MEFANQMSDMSQGPNMNFNVPPPTMTASMPAPMRPPPMGEGGGGGDGGGGRGGGGRNYHHHHHGGAGKPGQPYFRPFVNFARGPGGLPMTQDDFDGKRLRKSVMRKTVDYNASIVRALQSRVWQRDYRDRRALQPESIYAPDMLPPPSYPDNPTNAVTTRFVKTATNKMRCPIFTLAWTPEGRRLVTGASSGEFTLWNGLTFNFETILQAHDVPVRTMVWSHNDNWMVTGDHAGFVKYWQSNMNNVRMFQAHKEPVRGISFSPTDNKFVSCSDDGTLRVWDFMRCQEEKVLRGHGADVKCVHWHPQKALIVSGSKDNQQPIKLWDPKSGQALATLHAHKSTVMDLKWNENGNWLITASRDHLLKLFDLRNLREEVQVFRGHKKEASAVSWHPVHEGLFSSGGSDGSILFWNVGTDKEVGAIETAHDSIVWTLAWHPLGHILCSGSNDHTIKFWTRNRPGDQMRDKYNLNTLPAGLQGLEECDIDDNSIIPGMGPEDKIDFTESLTADRGFIPGLDLDTSNLKDRMDRDKKVPYSKPIPRNFQAHWNDTGRQDDDEAASKEIKEVITQIVESSAALVPLQKIAPTAIVAYGKVIPVTPGSKLEEAISNGPTALNNFISAGEVEELNELIPPNEDGAGSDNSYSGDSKRQRSNLPYDHNAQLVYDKDSTQQPTFIPPLMALNVHVDANGSEIRRLQDEDFRAEDRDEREVWQSNAGGGNKWSGSSSTNPFAASNAPGNRLPPSLLNISIDPPDAMSAANNKWDSKSRRPDGFRNRSRDDKFRRRDSEGRRISRFDNNGENRSRRSGTSAERTSGATAAGGSATGTADGFGASGGTSSGGNGNENGNNNNSSSNGGGGRHRTGRSKRRN